jgi:hypothetical protein
MWYHFAMSEEVIEKKECGRTALWMVLVGMAIGFAYSVVILFLTPKKYESSTIVEFCKPPEAASEDEWSVANEVALITSPKLLMEVNEALNLCEQWQMDADQVVMVLTAITKVEAVDESDFQKITIRYASPEIAKDIACEFPKSYSRKKAAERRQKLVWKKSNLEAQIIGREDLVYDAGRSLRELLGGVGLVLSSGDQLERTTLADFYQSHPEKKAAAQAVDLDQYNAAWRDYASKQDTLKILQKERGKAILGETEPHVPLKVHGKAVRAKIAVFPNITEGLYWGLLKGLIFGLVLGALTLLFFKMKKGEEEEEEEVIDSREREPDPADTW